MSNTLLQQVLSEKISPQSILQWILSSEATLKSHISCSRGEFTSHLLNFIHKEALCFEKCRETPKKVHTPKAIRKLDLAGKPKRRSALFTENASKKTRNCLTNSSKFEQEEQKCEMRKSYPLSPVSPLYTRLNAFTNEPGSNSSTPKSSKSFCLGDFISPNRKSTGSKDKKVNSPQSAIGDANKRTRRINPTNVATRKVLTTDNSFDFKNDEPPTVVDFIQQIETPKKSLISKPQQKEITPDLDKVTKIQQLDILISLYTEVIQHNRVLNVTSELYFIMTLLLSKQYDSDQFSSLIFASIHNIVYFALNCLKKLISIQNGVMTLLDKSTLRLLTSNERIKTLDPRLIEELSAFCDEIDESPRKYQRISTGNFEKNVVFDFETDNRENFPTDASFHAFRKQRDMFYEILSAWEANHASDGWNFGVVLGAKVRNLLAVHADPANFRHLSRLIKSQLLITCIKMQDESLPENELSFLTTISNINAEKLNRLKSRLVLKDQSTGINSPPNFPGAQEFYKDLVLHAQTHIFCTHLRNVFIQDLLELNETSFESSTGVYTEIFDDATKANYCLVVKSLQLLAKFISYIESLPYKSANSTSLNDKITLEEVESRSWMSPTIDLHNQLMESIKNGTLVVLIPWFVQYLAMLDSITLRLPYFEPIFAELFRIFVDSASNSTKCLNFQLIRCCLGWLFEQNHFPSESFFHFLNFAKHCKERKVKDSLDDSRIIDLGVLHTICPFLNEFKKLLQYNCNRNGSITLKHITPVTAIEVVTMEMSEKRLKLQLQEAYLNSKPSSLRKTLEFVSERVASCIVKTICNCIVPDVKLKATNEKKALFGVFVKEDFASVKMEIQQKLSEIIDEHLNQLKTECDSTLKAQIEAKIRPAVFSLICAEELPETVDVCTEIASRMCVDRVRQWIKTRVNSSVFKEFEMDLEKIDKLLQKERDEQLKNKFKSLPTQGRSNIDHFESDDDENDARDIWNPSKLLTNLQRRCANLLQANASNKEAIEVKHVEEVLVQADRCHQHRSDLSDIAWHQVNQLIADYLILLCKNYPDLIKNQLLDSFIKFWKSYDEIYLKDIFLGVISVRNIVILMNFPQEARSLSTAAWQCYACILSRLLQDDLLTLDDFEAQCLAIFHENWDAGALEKISGCLRDVMNQSEGKGKEKFVFLLGFLADFCSDLDF